MTISRFLNDARGATAVEFALTGPVFFAVVFLVIEGSMLMWTQVGLQHGAEMAARCATINPSLCNSPASIQAFAVQQTYGLNPPPATFTYTAAACGNQVSASYTFNILVNFFSLPSIGLNAQSCFPT
jgi:Flp pilus assembly protein TadG